MAATENTATEWETYFDGLTVAEVKQWAMTFVVGRDFNEFPMNAYTGLSASSKRRGITRWDD